MSTIRPGPVLAIRADAGNRSGTGHVMRTLAVAREWIRRGGRVHYLCSSMTGALVDRLLAEGCGVEWLEGPDALASAAAAERLKAVMLLVDHYELDSDWWASLPKGRRWKTAAINDFTTPIHRDAGLLVSPRAKALPDEEASGPGFLPIRGELLRKSFPSPPPERAERLLLVLGGADPLNALPRVAEALMTALPGVEIRAVVGPAAENLGEVMAVAERHPGLGVVHRPETMLPHYGWADSAVVSPSTTAFEALHHGLVTGLVVTAGNQEEVASDLSSLGCAVVLADMRRADAKPDAAALREFAADPDVRRTMAAAGASLVDGMGASRFCDLLGLPEISFRPAEAADSRLVWEWANDPGSRAASFNSEPIPWERHDPWFRGHLEKDLPFWLAVGSQGDPLAVVRFDGGEEGRPVISLNLAPGSRGKGLAGLIVRLACDRLIRERAPEAIDAWIRTENVASQRCFERAGFAAVREMPDRLLYRFHP